MTARTARCDCGQLTVRTFADPYAMVICHCRACQRRTGAPYGLGVYMQAADAKIDGKAHSYVRQGESGGDFDNRFCPDCGTTVYWTTGFHPEGLGLAFGCFEGDDLPVPDRSVWEEERHRWVEVPTKLRWLRGRAGPMVESG